MTLVCEVVDFEKSKIHPGRERYIPGKKKWGVCVCCSVVSLWEPMVCPWNSPGKNTGVGCHSLLPEIFPTQGLA